MDIVRSENISSVQFTHDVQNIAEYIHIYKGIQYCAMKLFLQTESLQNVISYAIFLNYARKEY